MVNYRDTSIVKNKLKKMETRLEVGLSIQVSPHLSSMFHAIWQWCEGNVCSVDFCGMFMPQEKGIRDQRIWDNKENIDDLTENLEWMIDLMNSKIYYLKTKWPIR